MQQKPLKKTQDLAETTMSKGLYQAMDPDEDSDKYQYIEQNAKVAETSEEDPRIKMRSTRENKPELFDE